MVRINSTGILQLGLKFDDGQITEDTTSTKKE